MNKKGICYFAFTAFTLGALAAVPLRVCLILFAIDPKTGFYIAGSQLVNALNVLLFVLTLVLIVPLLFMKQQGTVALLPRNSKPLAAMGALFSLSLAADALVSLGSVFSSQAGAGVFLSAVAEIFAAIFFFALAGKKFTGSEGTLTYAALVPALWAAVTLTVTFMHYTTIANISEYMLDVLKMVFGMVFLYYHARLLGRVSNGKEIRGLFASGLPAALFCLVSTLPYYIARLMNGSRGHYPKPGDIVYVVFAVYILVLLGSLLKIANTSAETDTPQQSSPGKNAAE